MNDTLKLVLSEQNVTACGSAVTVGLVANKHRHAHLRLSVLLMWTAMYAASTFTTVVANT